MKNPESMSNEELDQAVAVEVMGWTRSNKPGWEVWWISGTVGVEVADRWHPSTSIEAAWSVVERMRVTGGWWLVISDHGSAGTDYRVSFQAANARKWHATHASAPMAICLAALTASRGAK